MQTRWIPVTAGLAVLVAGGTATGAMAQVPPAAPTPMPVTVIAPALRVPVSVAVAAPRAPVAPMSVRVIRAPVAIVTYADNRPLPELSRQGDPADSLYRAARNALQRGRYREAADLMRDVRSRYPRSTYVADSYYWEAYALSRTSGSSEWRRAAAVLDEQASKYPAAAEKGDARTLRAEVSAKLARGGDANAAEDMTRIAVSAGTPVPPRAPRTPRAPRPPRGGVSGGVHSPNECDDEDDVQSAALQGLLQMDAAKAMPVLRKVLARRDSGSACLRRRAVFIVSQQGTNAEPILLEVARNDPDAEVRGQAVFWLSQVNSPAATAALDSILKFSKDPEVQDKAIFAISQQDSPKATQILRDYVMNESAPDELREKAVFWLGQKDDEQSRTFMRDLYKRTMKQELKEKSLFSVSQSGDASSKAWLVGIVKDPREGVELRKKALFWLGQQHMNGTELTSLYGQLTEQELREQLVFALSQSSDKAAIDGLINIARNDKDPELRKKAIFWLGQSNDPRAAEVLEKILTGEK